MPGSPDSDALTRLLHSELTFFSWQLDADGTLDYASQNLPALLGLSPAALLESGRGFWSLCHPAEASPLRTVLEAAAARGRTRFVHNHRMVRTDGEIVWVSGATDIVPPEGEGPARLTTFLRDVTATKEAELRAKRQRERFELVLEGTRLGMWDWNPGTNAVTFNDRWAEMLGHKLEEIPFELESWKSRVHPDDLQSCYDDLGAHMSGEVDFYENVHRMRHKDGSWRYILDRGKIVERDDEGNPIRFTGTHTDITAQKQAELEARAAVAAKGRFLATMSHEIRTPLHGILGVVRMLQQTPLTAEQLDMLGVIEQCGDGLQVLINDILDFSKLEEGQLRIEPHDFELAAALTTATRLYDGRASANGVHLNLRLDPDLPRYVRADSHRIKQVLMNLISNAIKFTDRGGRVDVSAVGQPLDADRVRLVVSVADTGKGIEDVERIWERFSQEDDSISRNYGGTGLGLSICRELTTLMGGAIAVESAPGRGATFTFSLPLARAAATEAAEQDALSAPDLRILVVDDDPINRLVLSHQLKAAGLRYEIAVGGAEAAEKARSGGFDVVLMDLHMPDVDGLEATGMIRASALARQPYVVCLSADAISETRERCTAAGMDDFLEKPFKPHQLIALLRRAAVQLAA